MPFSTLAAERVMSLEKSKSLSFTVRVEDRLHENIIDEHADTCWFTVRPVQYEVGQDDDDLPDASQPATGAGFKADGVFSQIALSVEQEALLSQEEQDRLIQESRVFSFDIQAAALDLDPETEWFYDISYAKTGFSTSLVNGPAVINPNPTNRSAEEVFGGTGGTSQVVATLGVNNQVNVTTTLPSPKDGPAGSGVCYTTAALNPTVGMITTAELSTFVLADGRSLQAGDMVYSINSPGVLGVVSAINWNHSPLDVAVTTLQIFGIEGLNALSYANVITGAATGGDPSYATATTVDADWTVLKPKIPMPAGHYYHVGDLVVGFARQAAVAGSPARLFIGLVKSFTATQVTVTTKSTLALADSSSVGGLLESKANASLQVNGVGIVEDSISLNLGNIPDGTSHKRMTTAERSKLSALPSASELNTSLGQKADSLHSHSIDKVTGLQDALNEAVSSTDISSIVVLTASAYAALSPKDSRTLYMISG